jgi:hypothetical protein
MLKHTIRRTGLRRSAGRISSRLRVLRLRLGGMELLWRGRTYCADKGFGSAEGFAGLWHGVFNGTLGIAIM